MSRIEPTKIFRRAAPAEPTLRDLRRVLGRQGEAYAGRDGWAIYARRRGNLDYRAVFEAAGWALPTGTSPSSPDLVRHVDRLISQFGPHHPCGPDEEKPKMGDHSPATDGSQDGSRPTSQEGAGDDQGEAAGREAGGDAPSGAGQELSPNGSSGEATSGGTPSAQAAGRGEADDPGRDASDVARASSATGGREKTSGDSRERAGDATAPVDPFHPWGGDYGTVATFSCEGVTVSSPRGYSSDSFARPTANAAAGESPASKATSEVLIETSGQSSMTEGNFFPPDGAEPAKSGLGSSVSRTPRLCDGGEFAELTRGTRRREPTVVKDARDVKRALERWFNQVDMGPVGDPSPRIDPKKLVTELVSRRVSLARARRRELEPAVRLVLADVSGSCSGHCRETVAAAQDLAEHDPRYAVIVHSNGFPLDGIGIPLVGAAKCREENFGQNANAVLRWWRRLFTGRRIAGVVAFGDGDAEWVYQDLARSAPLVWLDPFGCRLYGLRRASRRYLAALDWTPAAWWLGVQDGAAVAIALRQVS